MALNIHPHRVLEFRHEYGVSGALFLTWVLIPLSQDKLCGDVFFFQREGSTCAEVVLLPRPVRGFFETRNI